MRQTHLSPSRTPARRYESRIRSRSSSRSRSSRCDRRARCRRHQSLTGTSHGGRTSHGHGHSTRQHPSILCEGLGYWPNPVQRYQTVSPLHYASKVTPDRAVRRYRLGLSQSPGQLKDFSPSSSGRAASCGCASDGGSFGVRARLFVDQPPEGGRGLTDDELTALGATVGRRPPGACLPAPTCAGHPL